MPSRADTAADPVAPSGRKPKVLLFTCVSPLEPSGRRAATYPAIDACVSKCPILEESGSDEMGLLLLN